MPVTFRRLDRADVPALRELNTLFASVFGDHERYAAQPPDDGYLEAQLGKDHIVVLVAQADETIVGGLVAYEFDKLERAEKEVYIYDLAVDEAHRRCGIATGLIGRLREIAADRGAWVIFVQADYGDDPAIALYEKMGVREDVMHFDIAVDKKKS